MLTKLEKKRRWISDKLVQYVDIVFGVVVGQSMISYKDLIQHPLTYPFASTALLVVVMTVTLSWIGYHKSMHDYPYKAHSLAIRPMYRLASGFRLFIDFAIVVAYVLLLFTVSEFNHPVEKINLFSFISFYVLIFALYITDGVLRVLEYRDKYASRLPLNFRYGGSYLILLIVYFSLIYFAPPPWYTYVGVLNWLSLFFCAFLYFRYRREREPHYTPIMPFNQKRKLMLVIDVDGVLADQVTPVLKRINDEFGSKYVKEDIRHWDEPLPLAHTDIKTEIENSHNSPEFVKKMQPIPNALEVVRDLSKYFEISIATNRTAVANKPTQEWLKDNNIPHDEYHNTSLEGKGRLKGDVIIDDYPKNILAFTEKGNRKGIVFTQPWNESDTSLLDRDDIYRAKDWLDVWNIINSFDTLPF